MTESSTIRTFGRIAGLSVFGIATTFLFQIATARYLNSIDFVLFSSFIAIVNIAAIGGGALQNSVAVNSALSHQNHEHRANSDGSVVEAISLGVVGALLAGIATSVQAGAIQQHTGLILAAMLSVPVSFGFSRNLGILQGNDRASATVGWTTLTSALRLAFFPAVIWAGFEPLESAIVAVLLSMFVTKLGSLAATRRLSARPHNRPFSRSAIIIILTSVSFAWLTNADVLYVGAGTDTVVAGSYAITSVIIKTSLIVPGTLSLVFLSRFARQSGGIGKNQERAIEAVSVAGLALLSVFLYLTGELLLEILFGEKYFVQKEFLMLFGITFLPWVYIQAILIRAHSIVRWAIALSMLFAILLQFGLASSVLPDLNSFLIGNGVVGIVLASSIKLIVARGRRPLIPSG